MKRLLVFLCALIVAAFAIPEIGRGQTINRADIPVASYFYMPVGDRSADIRNDLEVANERPPVTPQGSTSPDEGHPALIFPGDYVYNGTTYQYWYVNTGFNNDHNYRGEWYNGNHDYHPGEDWNGNGGSNTDIGQPIFACAVGRVLFSGTAFGHTVIVAHKLSDGELVASFYGHMQNASSLEVNDLVYPTTQVGAVGNSGTDPNGAHLHWEIRRQNMLSVDANGNISLDEIAAYWPGSYYSGQDESDFISANYYDPTDFIKAHNSVGQYSDGWHTDGMSQSFVDCFNANGGHVMFGQPWDNGVGDEFVHYWPDNAGDPSQPGHTDALLVQDFLNEQQGNHWYMLVYNPNLNQAFPVHGQILSFWWTNTGYTTYGPPIDNEFFQIESGTGHQFSVQEFQKAGGSKKYIAYDNVDSSIEEIATYQMAGSGIYTPTNLVVAIVSSSQINLSWQDNNPSGTTWKVYRNGSYLTTVSVKSYSDVSVSASTTYSYRISAIVNSVESLKSNPVTVTTPAEGGTGGSIPHVLDLSSYLLDFGYTDTQKLLIVMNANSQSGFSWTATASQSWISLSRTSGTASSYNTTWGHHDSIMVTINRSALADSTQYQESISIGGSGGSQNVPVIVEKNTVFEGPITYSFNTGQGHWIIVHDPSGLSGLASSGALKLVDNGEAYLHEPGSIFSQVHVKATFDNGVSNVYKLLFIS